MMDVALKDAGDLVIPTRWVSGRELVAQRMRIRLRTFAGEYILDRTQGLPYIEWRSVKVTDLDTIRSAVGAEIAGTPGVERVTSLTASLDGRVIRLSVRVLLTEEVGGTEEQVALDFGTGGCTPSPLTLMQLIWGA